MGMAEDKARLLAEQAALGAAQMVIQNQQLSLETLRTNVMSKGGTTAKAVETFQQGDLAGLVDKAMNNCVARAQEMAKMF
jgi:pyrroline-5-carboxylate reductase